MARIPLVTLDTMSPEQQQAYDAILARNHRIGRLPGPYWMLLHSPELSDKVSHVGELLRYRTKLEPRLSELTMLAGYHGMVAWTLNAHQYDRCGIPAGAPLPLPPKR